MYTHRLGIPKRYIAVLSPNLVAEFERRNLLLSLLRLAVQVRSDYAQLVQTYRTVDRSRQYLPLHVQLYSS
jgi:hypothetical protein